jgi:hypothetical protein
LDFGIWSLEFESLEFGAWNLELGAWSLEFGAWNLEPGMRELMNVGISGYKQNW